jgi:DNA-binding LacI/PurR family transcriptional regulator
MATINDVCKLAGVSKATVSRVMNGTGQVKESTAKVVLQAMEQLSFKPNRLAQALANNSSNSIGLILSDFSGDYFGTILKQAAKGAEVAGKQLIVTDGHDDHLREIEAIDSLVEHCCDAIVLYSRSLSQQDLSNIKARINIPLVIINRQLEDKSINAVYFDQESIAKLAVNQLLDLNHKKIAYITSPLDASTGQLRLKAYKEALMVADIVPNEALIVEGKHTMVSGYQACQNLLATGIQFTALFASNDEMAIGAMKALTEAGKMIPDDISIIAIDDSPPAQFVMPTLSSVELPVKELTDTAMKIALDLAAGKEVKQGVPGFQGKVVLRDSTAEYYG